MSMLQSRTGERVTKASGHRRWMYLAVPLSLLLMLPQAAYASVSATSDDTARVNGTVYAVAQVGTRTIIGGEFTTVGGVLSAHPRSR